MRKGLLCVWAALFVLLFVGSNLAMGAGITPKMVVDHVDGAVALIEEKGRGRL